MRPVSSIWSPLTRRRWWNHIGDDTALGGITSAMIRRQPDHLNCPSSYPFSPFSPFPFQSNPLARLRGAVPVWGTQVRPPPKPLLLWPKQPRQGRQGRQASKAGKRGCCSVVYWQADAPKAVKHSGREGMVQRYLSGVSCSV